MQNKKLSRRAMLLAASVAASSGAAPSAQSIVDGYLPTLKGEVIDLVISESQVQIGTNRHTAPTVNANLPGPTIRLREGQDVTLRVTNRLAEDSSIHWHGILLPAPMDGVPGVSFAGIKPGATFEYRFRVKQSGTYWYHSHSGGQEQAGVYGPIIIDPSGPDPIQADRDYVVLLSDWTTKSADAMIGDLKKQSGVYNYQRRTLPEFLRDAKRDGLGAATRNYALWSKMRMDPTDLLDVTSARYTYLMNGSAPESNWTGLFKPGERVRLRFIQAGAMTFQDVRIPGLKMTVVQADGQNIQPVEVDEFRIGPAETYDVIVQPDDDKAYTIFAETLDRNGYARGTLAPRSGMTAAIPARRPRPLRTMEDMGMSMQGGDMAGMPGMKGMSGMSGMKDAHGTKDMPGMKKPAGKDSGHDMANMPMPPNAADKGTPAQPPPDPAKAHDMANMSSPKANDPHAGHNMAGMAGKAPATSIPGKIGRAHV